ncbi:MBL fold metallo-hydrolase [Modestobacter versicolor]|uniref:L-ascorbate metabolism protein UlaG (Beta-lactamase superfamily) n=1 Tax=Modestobacter versicolor TaxID=429133 RepID=A0A323VGG4_9ACTN|nr:MBL fold metallo-hydrolase [Modestobacter versicolor]MBB3674383.1 L-ascorbate metabolism protein UlaG (beta-lactamase superfamily) [Modestobacter versicolor]PZA23120.1 MBL fold metallo-hydrolase [Modestobacter versicolor]
MRLTHIGGPTLLVEVAGWRLLTDPTFDPPGRRYAFGWGTSSRKLIGPAVQPADLPDVDAVLLTHDHHADNLDDAGRAYLPSVPVVVTTASGAARLGGTARGVRPGESTVLEAPGRPALTVTATPARHGPPLSRPVAGDVVGFALRWDDGSLWVSGDTVLFRGLREVAERLHVDTAVLHLGGVRFPVTGPLRYSMTGRQAVRLCGVLDARTVVPVHVDGWSHFAQDRAGVERDLARAPADVRRRFRWLPVGRAVELEPA